MRERAEGPRAEDMRARRRMAEGRRGKAKRRGLL
jgi:hypothetical protein